MHGFKIVGWVLLVLFVCWMGFSLSKYPVVRPAPIIVQPSIGFEATSVLSASTANPHIDRARARMLAINGHGQAFSIADSIASWLSFLCTATVTLILGYFGRRTPADGANAEVSGLPLGIARTIGLLAALAAVLTAAGALAKNQSREDYQHADLAQSDINTAISDLSSVKSEREAQDVLDKLDLQIGRL